MFSKECWVFAFLLPLPGEIKDNPRSVKTLQEGNLREDIEGRKRTHILLAIVEGFMELLVAIRVPKTVTTWGSHLRIELCPGMFR